MKLHQRLFNLFLSRLGCKLQLDWRKHTTIGCNINSFLEICSFTGLWEILFYSKSDLNTNTDTVKTKQISVESAIKLNSTALNCWDPDGNNWFCLNGGLLFRCQPATHALCHLSFKSHFNGAISKGSSASSTIHFTCFPFGICVSSSWHTVLHCFQPNMLL